MKVDFKINAILSESAFSPVYQAVITGEGNSWGRTIAKLYARGVQWTEAFRNKRLVTIIDNDGNYDFVVHQKDGSEIKFSLDMGQVAEVRALLEVMNRTISPGRYFTPLKITSIKETRGAK